MSSRPAGSRTTSDSGSRKSPACPSRTPTTRPCASRSTTVRIPAWFVNATVQPSASRSIVLVPVASVSRGEPVGVVPEELGEQPRVGGLRRRHPAGDVVAVDAEHGAVEGGPFDLPADRVQGAVPAILAGPSDASDGPAAVADHVGGDAHRIGRRSDPAARIVGPRGGPAARHRLGDQSPAFVVRIAADATGRVGGRPQEAAFVPVELGRRARRVDRSAQPACRIAFEPRLAGLGAETRHAAVLVPDHLDRGVTGRHRRIVSRRLDPRHLAAGVEMEVATDAVDPDDGDAAAGGVVLETLLAPRRARA